MLLLAVARVEQTSSYGRDQTCAMLYAILGGNSHILTELPAQNQSLRVSRGVDANLNARQLLFAIGGKPNGGSSHIGLSFP